jgi:hypothetical protein
MTAIMARRPFAISSQNLLVFAAGSQKPTAPARREHAMIAILARRPFAISSQHFSVFAAGSKKPTGACT